MKTHSNLIVQSPVAYIVQIPNSLKRRDLAYAHVSAIHQENSVNEMNFIPYVEVIDRVLISTSEVLDEERQHRENNLQMLRDRKINVLIITGSSTSDYIREILYWAMAAGVGIASFQKPGSALDKTLRLMRPGSEYLRTSRDYLVA